MFMVTEPSRFDVIVTTNLYGDILSDEAAGLIGGLGLAPSANIGETASYFEPVHGSAPDIAGKWIANPTATLLAAAMMLEHLGMVEAGERMRKALESCYTQGISTPDQGGNLSTQEFAREVAKRVWRGDVDDRKGPLVKLSGAFFHILTIWTAPGSVDGPGGRFLFYSDHNTYSDYMTTTTIQVDSDIRDLLKSFGRKGETYNDIIKNLIMRARYVEYMHESYKIVDNEKAWVDLDEL